MREKGLMRAGQRATAEDDRADGAGRMLIRDMDVTARRFPFDSHFRNDRDAHACTHHAEQTTELAAFENDLGMKARAVAGGNGRVPEAMTVTQQ
jgi:hypothetical protein